MAAIQRFIERFATAMVEAGMPRMPSRIFAALQCADSGRLTAAELAELLQISPAAVSGAVRYLIQTELIVRERDPGSRRDHFTIHENLWYEAIFRRERVMARWRDCAVEGMEILGAETPAGRRMDETREFFEFLQDEMPEALGRWRKHKEQRP